MTFPTWSVGEVLTAADMNTVGAICSTSVTSFKNAIINGDFSINQRGFTSSTTSGNFGFDRWRMNCVGGTCTYTSQTFTLGNQISGQEPANFARLATTGQSAAGDLCLFYQQIESVRTFAGQQVTISFWAKAGSGTPKVAVELLQSFGTGGSPSADVTTYLTQITLSTSWTRFSVTGTVPSISGKTLGTGGNDFLGLVLWTSAGSTYNSRTGSLGIQNATIDFWGVQVEAGSVMTFFERRPRQVELALCQRYFWSPLESDNNGYTHYGQGFAYSTTQAFVQFNNPVQMRVPITSARVSYSTLRVSDTIGAWAVTAISVSDFTKNRNSIQVDVTIGTASFTSFRPCLLQSNNSASAYIRFDAEL